MLQENDNFNSCSLNNYGEVGELEIMKKLGKGWWEKELYELVLLQGRTIFITELPILVHYEHKVFGYNFKVFEPLSLSKSKTKETFKFLKIRGLCKNTAIELQLFYYRN